MKMSECIVHSFEAGRRGKPDELDSGIAHLVGAEILDLDRNARFDLRVHGSYQHGKPTVRISGEVSEHVLPALTQERLIDVVLAHYNHVHRTELSPSNIVVTSALKPQAVSLASNGHAGDSGNPIAVAYKISPDVNRPIGAPNYLPWERSLAVSIRNVIDNIFQGPETYTTNGIPTIHGLKADGKVSVDAVYEGARLVGIKNITIAVEHEKDISISELQTKLENIVREYLSSFEAEARLGNPKITINGLGAWHDGGWQVDEGSREAKPYRDGFASYGCCEDSFSGEDPTKPSATGTFLARYIAVQIVANDLADFARVALQYTIGREEVGLNSTTNGTGRVEQSKLETWIRNNVPLRIKDAIELFGLRDPALYRRIVAQSDFFHDGELPWNKPTGVYNR